MGSGFCWWEMQEHVGHWECALRGEVDGAGERRQWLEGRVHEVGRGWATAHRWTCWPQIGTWWF